MDFVFGPDERLCIFVVSHDEGVDLGFQFIEGVERSAVEGFSGEDQEPGSTKMCGMGCSGSAGFYGARAPFRVWAYGWRDCRGSRGYLDRDRRRRPGS